MGIRDINKGSNFRSSFGVESLHNIFEKGYLSNVRGTGIQKKETFAPSSIGYDGNGRCPRYWYMAFEGRYVFEETTDAMGMATMLNGRDAGERIAKIIGDAGALVATEVEVTMKDPPIRGYIDALVRIGDEIVVGEIKTTRQEMFVLRQNTMKPLPYHLYQLLIYMKATGKSKGFLFYENRNDLSYLILPVEMNESYEKILEDALNWLRKVRQNWEAEGDTLPTRPFTQKSKQCKQCPLFNECWNNLDDGKVTIAPMVVAKP
jgi:CRISPR/Cas system-associated exonuclease Cas4 (RecB family)